MINSLHMEISISFYMTRNNDIKKKKEKHHSIIYNARDIIFKIYIVDFDQYF
jgi:hypothetical protein